jgi:hypothetical protein
VPKGKESGRMEQNTKLLFLFQAIASLWFLSLVFMVLVWVWTLFTHQDTRGKKGPSLNIKEL